MPNNVSVATIYTIEVQPNIICEHDKSRLSFISEISNKDHPYKISDITAKHITNIFNFFSLFIYSIANLISVCK